MLPLGKLRVSSVLLMRLVRSAHGLRAESQIEYLIHKDIPVTVGLVVDNSGSMRPEGLHLCEY